ncbi:hypothetical protein [Streptomyces sp. NPDC095602]|uniref:hypothetical protein n=1 Tax=unclassified Streptomyces TaxID=2593676 RepID=UPI00332BE6AD
MEDLTDMFIENPSDEDCDKAMDYFQAVVDIAGDGRHIVTVSATALDGPVAITWPFELSGEHIRAEHEPALGICTLLAVAVGGHHSASVVLRTLTGPDTSRVRAWHFCQGEPHPVPAGALFNAYCTDPETGEIAFGPCFGTEVEDAPALTIQ